MPKKSLKQILVALNSDRLHLAQFSTINFSAMSHSIHAYFFGGIIDFINDSVIADANSPIAISAG
jgi:hypothetical protein